MNEEEFRRLLRLGHGRAVVYARSHDIRQFRQAILDACLHCGSHDPQIEGTRADYMFELLKLIPDRKPYDDAMLNALADSKDGWDAVQRFWFAAYLALDGNERARSAMYRNYDPGPKNGEAIGVTFLEIDGIKGLLFAAEKIGELLSGAEKVDLGLLPSVAKERLGEQVAQEALRKAGAENPRIEAYRLALEASGRRSDEHRGKADEMRKAPYEQVKNKLSGMISLRVQNWGWQASEADIQRAARDLAASRDPKEQRVLLQIFAGRSFPLEAGILLNLVDVGQERVDLAALQALSQITNPTVRQLTFRLIDTRAKGRGQAIDLLARNFEVGDHAVVLGWLEAEDDDEVLHSMGLDVTHFWKEHPDEESELRMLKILYERDPCSFCRERTVRRLIELGALTEEQRLECLDDANSDIRELIQGPSSPPPE